MTSSSMHRAKPSTRLPAPARLRLAPAVPTHGAGAASEPGVRLLDELDAPLHQAVFGVLRATAALGVGQLTVRADGGTMAISPDEGCAAALGRCEAVLGDADAVTVTAAGDQGGELVWRLAPGSRPGRLDVSLESTAGLWYAEVLATLLPAACRLAHDAGAAGSKARVGDLDGFDRHPWAQASRGPERLPISTCLLAEVRRMAGSAPDRIAVRDSAGSTSYAELVEDADRIGALLVDAGVEPGDLVAVDVPRGRRLVASMLGAWRARCVFVALDPRDRGSRRAHVLDAARPRLVLGSGAGADVDVDGRPAATSPSCCCRPDDAAYVMFTSGSTGAPKGATVRHDGMLNHAWAKLDDLQVSETDVVAQTGPISFDIVVWQCVAPLLRGARVEVVPDEDVRDVRRTLSALEESGVTVWQALPALIRAALETAGSDRPLLSALRWVVPTGDALPTDLCHSWLGAYPGVPLLNTYGSTECSDDQCHHVVDRVRASDPPVMLLGRPVPGMTAFVLDAEGRVAPPGVPGELHVGGLGVGPGYWRRPDLTADRFVVRAGLEEEGRLYRSGDLVRRRTDGALEFLGRLDDTVKVRGRRIETAMVEAALRRHPEVQDCAVVGQRNDADLTESRLVAFVVAPTGVPKDLVDHVASLLDEHHVPDQVAHVARLPLSANGKVDRSALRAPEVARRGSGSGDLSPGHERLLAELWSEVLAVTDVGRNDDFFVLGGHSLAVGRLLARVADRTGVDLPLHAVYDHPTIAGLARLLDEQAGGGAASGSVGRIHVARGGDPAGALPLTELQQAYVVGESELLGGGRMRAHLHAELETTGLEVGRLARALDRLVASHEVLRTVVTEGESRLLTSVPGVHVEHVVATGPEEMRSQLEQQRHRFRDLGPSTSSWPLFDVAVVEHEDEQHLFVAISLLLADAATEAVLVRDLVAAYTDAPTALRSAGASYGDVLRAVDASQRAPRDADLAHWNRVLEDFPGPPALPYAEPSTGARHGDGSDRVFTRRVYSLGEQEWAAFRARAAARGLTPTAALFSVYASVLARWSKSPRFAINTLASLRLMLDAEVDDLAGNFSSTLPAVVDLGGGHAFADAARRVQRDLVSDLEHARTSGVAVVRRLASERGWGAETALPVVFASTLDVCNPGLADLPLPARLVSSGVQTPHVHLDHQVYEYGGRFHAVADSLDSVFEPGVVEELWAAYCGCVEELASSEAAWDRALEPRATSVPEPVVEKAGALLVEGHGVLHAPFVARARREPGAVAVTDADGTALTYGQLLARAHQVATVLSDQGVSRGDLVAHVMRRGWEQVVAMIGTHLAGAAYLPVDATNPDDRVRYLLAQATAPLVLSQQDQAERLGRLGASVLDVSGCLAETPPEELPDGGARPEDVAYVIFTSGSTGRPKGVTVDHRGAVNTIAAVNEQVRLDAGDAVLGLSSTSFDLSVWDVYGTLAVGGHLVLLAQGEYRDPAHWHDQVVRHRVTVWNSVPALLDLYVRYLESGWGGAEPVALRLAMLSGDWIPVSLPDRARATMPGLDVLSLGGATEASIWSIGFRVHEVDPGWRSVPYGTALPNQGMHVVDSALDELPAWVVGEICISGTGLALGYWRDPERTAERFVTHPRTGLRLYRTGDLGRRRPDGVIEFLGREDNQVKLQGHRVELGEIEARLNTHPAVAGSVVVVHVTEQDGRTLAAYVVSDDEDHDPLALRRFVAEALPAYMVPHHVARLERLPLTANGKVDRQALPAPSAKPVAERAAASASGAAALPDPIALAVLDQIREILAVPDLGLDDSFLEHGGNSFSAMRLVARLRHSLGVDLRLSRIFDAPSARAIGELVSEREDAPAGDEVLVPLRPTGTLTPLFLAHPVGGAVSAYGDLVAALHPDRPAFGLQATVADDSATLEDLMARYADTVERAWPVGPVALGGWSMGGVLAHGIAGELTRRGREVGAVLVIDSSPSPEQLPTPEPRDDGPVSAFLFDLSGGTLAAAEVVAAMQAVVGAREARDHVAVEDALTNLVSAGVVPRGVDAVVLRERFRLFVANTGLLAEHRARPCGAGCPVPLVVVHATGSHLDASQTADEWSRVCAGARIVPVAGDHYSVVRGSAASAAAAELERALDITSGDVDALPGGVVDALPGGVVVRDDHRWMETGGACFDEWLHEQGERTAAWFDGLAGRAAALDEVEALVAEAEELTNPQPGGDEVFALLRVAGDVTPRLVTLPENGPPRVVLDPAHLDPGLVEALGPRSHVSVDWFTPAPTGAFVAVGLSVDGSEEATLVVVDADGRPVPGLVVSRAYPMRINRANVGGVSWRPDGRAIAYLRLQELDGRPSTARYQDAAACVRTLEEPLRERVVARRELNPDLTLAPDDLPLLTLLPDDRAVLTVARGSTRERRVLTADDVVGTDARRLDWHVLAECEERVLAWCASRDRWYAGHATDDGWRVTVRRIDGADAPPQVVHETSGSALEDLVSVGDNLLARTIEDGAGALSVLGGDGARPPDRVPLPERSGVAAVAVHGEHAVDVLVTGWLSLSRLVRVDLLAGTVRDRWTPRGGASDVACRLVSVGASDGERIPVTLIGAPAAGAPPAPLWLTAYGFFGITLRPVYTPLFHAWVRRGGVVAIAHVRGGGDRGEAWYRAGHREHTGRSVADLVEVAQHLAETGLTSAALTVVEGTSAGGLTVGGAMAARPDAFGAVVLRVSLTNTLRLEMHENGPPNVPEYGSIATAEGVRALLASDVYHRVDEVRTYPPVLLTVGMRDPRVLPWQPAKLAARLQRRHPEAARLRVEELGGHGIGAATSQNVAEAADRLAFAVEALERRTR